MSDSLCQPCSTLDSQTVKTDHSRAGNFRIKKFLFGSDMANCKSFVLLRKKRFFFWMHARLAFFSLFVHPSLAEELYRQGAGNNFSDAQPKQCNKL